MADLVFGLAKTAVKETVNIAKSAIEEEKSLQKSVQRDLMLISDEFEMMHSFLNVAKERAADDMTTTCVRQVRDMALDVEDCIESILHLDNKSSWWRHTLPSCIPAAAPAVALDEAVSSIELLKARVKAVGQRNMRYSHIGESSSKPDNIQMHHQQALDNTAASNILAMARDASEIWSSQVDLVTLINKKDTDTWQEEEEKMERDEAEETDDDDEDEEGYEMDRVEEEQEDDASFYNVEDTMEEEEVGIYEMKAETEGEEEKFYEMKAENEGGEEKFYEMKVEEKKEEEKPPAHSSAPASATGVLQLQVIAVLGTRSDLGMMSIKKAYDDPKTCKSFICRAWVKLMHPFQPHSFICNILAQFYKNNHQVKFADVLEEPMDIMVATDDVLVKEFKKQINQKYLVVLEDVSTIVDWEAVRVYLPDKNNGSCIVVHTQQLGIGSSCVGHPHTVLKLERYSADHSVCAIYKDNEKGDKTNNTKTADSWSKKFRVGRKAELGFIHCKIKCESGVVAIWGIPCVGKSYLAKRVYYQHVKYESAQYYGWVTVSHPFNLRDLSQRLLINFHSESLSRRSIMGIKDPIEECRELLQGNDCLVVIDGLRSADEWDSIKNALALGRTRSRVIVITNEERVATYCARSREAVLNVEGLEVHEALDLFKKKIGQPDLNPELTKRATHMLHKCGGLPKVITAIASYLGYDELASGPDSSKWRRLTDRFMPELENNEEFSSLRGLLAWMHSYFRTCPDFLKPCIFYLSIFPLNHSIRRRRLVRRWIAEGYSRGSKVEGTTEETAEEFFYQLVRLSMIQEQHEWGSVTLPNTHFKVNGFFREYIMSRSMEENLVFALDGHCRKNSVGTGRHLTIQRNWDGDGRVFESIDLSRLRSLTVFGNWKSFFISDKINMMLLRVLDLEDASDVKDDDVEKMAERLPRLKFLSLRGCKEVKCLPDSLGNLRQLQTLDVRDTSIVKLPKSIVKLKKLQYVRAGSTISLDDDRRTVQTLPPQPAAKSSLLSTTTPLMCRPSACSVIRLSKLSRHSLITNGVKVPRNMFIELSDLHTLGVVNISGACRMKAALEDLRYLTQLHKLGVSGVNRSNIKELFSAISGLHHLKTLSVQVDKDSQGGCFDGTYPPENLQSLKLYGLVGEMPVWIEKLRNLKKLSLQSTMLAEGEISSLTKLPSLDILHLCLTEPRDGKLDFCEGKKLDVLVLDIACNSRLNAVKFNRGLINVLKIRCCRTSSSLRFSGLRKLNFLTEVWLSGTYDHALRQDLERQVARHPRRPVLSLEEPRTSI